MTDGEQSKYQNIWPKDLTQLNILTLALLHDSQVSNGQNSEFWAYNTNWAQNFKKSVFFIVSRFRAVTNLNFGQNFKHGQKLWLLSLELHDSQVRNGQNSKFWAYNYINWAHNSKKNGNFYHFQVQSSSKIEFKNLNSAKNLTFA